MRSSIASIIFAFCAIVAVNGAPTNSVSALIARTDLIVARGEDEFEYDADGNEIEKSDNSFQYDAEGNEIDAAGNVVERRGDFEYDADGNELDSNVQK